MKVERYRQEYPGVPQHMVPTVRVLLPRKPVSSRKQKKRAQVSTPKRWMAVEVEMLPVEGSFLEGLSCFYPGSYVAAILMRDQDGWSIYIKDFDDGSVRLEVEEEGPIRDIWDLLIAGTPLRLGDLEGLGFMRD